MVRVKELQGARNIKKGTTPKTLPSTQTHVTPSIQNSSTKMLNRSINHTEHRQTRPIPTKKTRTPKEPNLSSTLKKQMRWPMTRGPISSSLEQPVNPWNLLRPKGQVPAHLTKAKPNNTKSRITTNRSIQQTENSTHISKRLPTRPGNPTKRRPQFTNTRLSQKGSLNPMQGTRNKHTPKNTQTTMKMKRQCKNNNQPRNSNPNTSSKGRRPTPKGSV